MSDITPRPETRIALFQRKEVRRAVHNNEWWFVVVDVVAALTDAPVRSATKVTKGTQELWQQLQKGAPFVVSVS